jgi:tetratricopeptide (TPR) repeat protein
MKMKTLRALTLTLVAAACFGIAGAQGLRAEIGKPLQQASELLRAGKAREALTKVAEAERVSNRSASEQLTIDRMKAAAAQRAGDNATAIRALEAIASKVGRNEAGAIAEQLAAAYAQVRNNAKATEWMNRAKQAGNNRATIQQLEKYLLGASGDYAAIARDAQSAISAAVKAGRRPDEAELLRLQDAQGRLGNTTAQVGTLERLLLNYPKKDYWATYLGRLPRKEGFAPRFELDVLRLRLATDTLTATNEFMDMAQLALLVGLPAEAERVIEQGFKAGTLGTGDEAARHQRLRDLAVRKLAEAKAEIAGQASEAAGQAEGDALVKVGYAYVTMGQADRGIKLIEQGIAKGKLRHPEEAKLRLGMAQLQQNGRRSTAVQTLRSIRGGEGAEDIARLWTVAGTP